MTKDDQLFSRRFQLKAGKGGWKDTWLPSILHLPKNEFTLIGISELELLRLKK
jgi:hypothetical protein